MLLFLVADAHGPSAWWFDFVDTWGNSASMVGVIIAVIAFPITWRLQAKIRRANQEAVRRVAFVVLGVTVEDLHRKLSKAREAGRLELWLRVFDCCYEGKFEILRLVGNPHLTEDEKEALRNGADNLTQVIEYLERNKLGDNPSPPFQQDKKDIIDGMVSLLTNIQGRLGARTWEV